MRTEFKDYREEIEYKDAYEKASTYYAIFWFWSQANGYNIYKGELKKAFREYCKVQDIQVKEMVEYLKYKQIRRDALNDYFKEKLNKERESNEREN